MRYEISSAADREELFWSCVFQDPVDFYFFILDWTKNRKDTKILLALDGNAIGGLVLIHDNRVVQLRGSRDAIAELVSHINLNEANFEVPLDCLDLLKSRYEVSSEAEMILMRVDKGKETPQVKHDTVRLVPDVAEEIAELMRRLDPVWWRDTTSDGIRKSIETNLFRGIRQEGKIASFGSAHRTDMTCSNISAIATHEQFRNKGYATSVTSFLVEEILKSHITAIIHVLSQNTPAAKAYSKVGFRPHRRYHLVHARKR